MAGLLPLPPLADPRTWPGLLLYAATVLLEAESESPRGQVAVAWVIRNRMDAQGDGIVQVCLAPRQFSAWNADYAGPRAARLAAIAPASWEAAWRAASLAYWRLEADPTGGALFYLNPAATRAGRRLGDLPAWYDAARVTLVEGRHEFLVA